MRYVKKEGWLAFFDYFNRFLSNRCVFDSFCFKQYQEPITTATRLEKAWVPATKAVPSAILL